MSNIKISVIGAGGSFVVRLIHDICCVPGLHGCTVSLMDVSPERLDTAHGLCTRLVRERGVNLHIEKTTDRRAALGGAAFVVTIALVDGRRRLEEGWRTALQLGFRWPGSFHILYDEPFWLNFYQLRLFEAITRDMLEVCPRAWHLLVSNPVLAATTLLQRKYPESRMVGLCHGFSGVFRIPRLLGLGPGRLTYEIPGVNHFVWLTRCRHEGREVYPILDQWLAREDGDGREPPNPRPGGWSLKPLDLYRQFGALPIGDTAHWTGASWPWWYHTDPEVEKAWGTESEAPWFEYLDFLRSTPDRHRKLLENTATPLAAQLNLGDGQSGEPMIPIVEAVALDLPQVIIVNLLNRDHYIDGIPPDFEVEIPALVSANGIQGIKTGGLPKPLLAHILRDRVAPVEMELAAYEEGRRDLLLQLVLMDKWTRSLQHANDLVEAIFALPYHEELRQHYR
jgi:alpha-galactosidase